MIFITAPHFVTEHPRGDKVAESLRPYRVELKGHPLVRSMEMHSDQGPIPPQLVTHPSPRATANSPIVTVVFVVPRHRFLTLPYHYRLLIPGTILPNRLSGTTQTGSKHTTRRNGCSHFSKKEHPLGLQESSEKKNSTEGVPKVSLSRAVTQDTAQQGCHVHSFRTFTNATSPYFKTLLHRPHRPLRHSRHSPGRSRSE